MKNVVQASMRFVRKPVFMAVVCVPAMLSIATFACSTSTTAPASSTKAANSVQGKHFVCPMHPEVISTDEGNCPQCGMKLVPGKTE